VIFLRAGALQACFVLLHPCLRILLAIYSEATACMRQLMCTAESHQLRSDQLVPLSIRLCTFDVPCMSIFLIYMCRAALICSKLPNACKHWQVAQEVKGGSGGKMIEDFHINQ